ncbi:MAG: hypothetical protein H6983_20305 [Ectothiorhodospiraceae bacterium]|nr:hypothetical protein [Ectothiorhodospiraceae bacterium]
MSTTQRLAVALLTTVLAGQCVPATARAAITVPDCTGLRAWATTVDSRDKSYAITPRLALPAALAPEPVTAAFGAAAPSWTGEDADAVRAALTACQKEAQKAKDRDGAGALRNGVAGIGALAKALDAIAKARAAVTEQMTAFAALPDSADLATAAGVVAAMDTQRPDPRALRGLDATVVAPLTVVAKNLSLLPDEEWQTIASTLRDRAASAQHQVADTLAAEVDAAPSGVDGVLALMALRARALALGDAEPYRAVGARAEARADELRQRLRAESAGAWVPPDCVALYAWAGAPDARTPVALGRQRSERLYEAAPSTPVFGVAVADWSDAELEQFARLRTLCQGEWRAALAASAHRRLESVPDDAEPLLVAARSGAWIDGAERMVTSARDAMRSYHAASQAVAAAQDGIAALPDSLDTLPRLSEIAALPALAEVNPEQRTALQTRVAAKRKHILDAAVDTALTDARALPVSTLAELPTLWEYGSRQARTLPDRDALARFQAGWELAVTAHLDRLEPEFRRRLDAIPVSLAGLAEAAEAVSAASGLRDARTARPFAAWTIGADGRARAIATELRAQLCTAEIERVGIDRDDAAILVWDGRDGIPLGDLACAMAARGNPMHAFDGGGLLSGDPSFKAEVGGLGYHTVHLHEGEVAPGRKMLVGERLVDANREQPIGVPEWVAYVRGATPEMLFVTNACASVTGRPESELATNERLLALDCLVTRLGR